MIFPKDNERKSYFLRKDMRSRRTDMHTNSGDTIFLHTENGGGIENTRHGLA